MIEGTGQTAWASNWGDGFATDVSVLKDRTHGALSDPNPFFTALLDGTKPYAKNVVLSPHVYPPSVADSGYSRRTNDSGYVPHALLLMHACT